jgi:hypothetical protein
LDHLGHLRSLARNPPNALFKGKAVTEFLGCKSLSPRSDSLKILNTAHHNKTSLSAGAVHAVATELDQVRVLTEALHREFRHWRWHEPLTEVPAPSHVVTSSR